MIEVQRIESSGWVIGTVGEYRFNAMIFREHSMNPEWELAGSKISKLWIQHQGKTVFNWDRGMDIDAKTEEVQDVVVLLCSELHSLLPAWGPHPTLGHGRSRSGPQRFDRNSHRSSQHGRVDADRCAVG